MRLAWFTPWPPQASGIAGRSVDVTRVLASRGWAIDVFVDRALVPSARPAPDDEARPGEVRVQSAHDFVWRRHRQQHDLVVYQLGNSTAHTFIWPYLLRYPGLVVLHDAHLHHSRGAALITPASARAYRAAFGADHPEVSGDVAELAVAGFDGSYYFLWPMVRSAVVASRAVGVHSRGAVQALQAVHPGALVDYLALGMGRDRMTGDDERQQVRRDLGIAGDALLLGVFGGLTADKRVPQILRAFARLRRLAPRAHLLLAGAPDPLLGLPHLIKDAGLSSHVTLAPALDDDRFERAMGAIDVSLNLRWPTARETSGPWLQALAAGRPTVVIDLEQHAHVPALDPQTWERRPGATTGDPVTVALDLLDEEHSLDLAMTRLALDPDLRAAVGRAARQYWAREHTVARMADDYERLIHRALAQTTPAPALPPDLRPDASRHVRDLVRPFGDLSCTLF
ncbi:MAG: glycosyltransferase family 4 protein [Acidobacteria bacterium]|nr:glycosyltransferase family 4 protein [Acidobacteriota bacterium]